MRGFQELRRLVKDVEGMFRTIYMREIMYLIVLCFRYPFITSNHPTGPILLYYTVTTIDWPYHIFGVDVST